VLRRSFGGAGPAIIRVASLDGSCRHVRTDPSPAMAMLVGERVLSPRGDRPEAPVAAGHKPRGGVQHAAAEYSRFPAPAPRGVQLTPIVPSGLAGQGLPLRIARRTTHRSLPRIASVAGAPRSLDVVLVIILGRPEGLCRL
jgi:hypothetical protein